MVFVIMNSIDILEELTMLMMITTNFAKRFHEDVIDQRRHQAKAMVKRRVIGTTDTTNLESSLMFELK